MSPQGISQRFGSVALSLVLAATILTLSPTAASTPDTDASSPALETFRVQKVIDFDLPAGVVAGSADLSPDAEHLLLEVEIDGQTQIAVTDLEGRNYQCVSCGATGNATKALALQDNKRIWFADTSGQQSGEDPSSGGTGTINYAVLECGPSIYDCQQRSVKKVKFPSDRRNLPAQNREAKPDPFGEYVTWNEVSAIEGTRMSIAALGTAGDGYELTGQRVFSPQWSKKSDYATDRENAMRFYEGASWHAGGRLLKYQTTTTGLNYDIYLMDTATGERRQLTTDLDYNESGDVAPDGKTVYFSSARGLDRMDVFTALERPSLIDSGAFGQIGRVGLWNNRRCMNEPWLMNMAVGQIRGGYSGQPLVIDPAWTLRGWSWFPDSTRAVVNEQQRPDDVTGPGSPDTPWRTSIIEFPTRTPSAPLAPVHQSRAAIETWSVPVKDYNPMMGRQLLIKVLKGKSSGTATLQYLGVYATGSYSVTYKNYSDDGRNVLNGTERIAITNAVNDAEWSADLTSKGDRTGYLKGTIKVRAQNKFTGKVTSEVNGVTYTGVPTQADCPAIAAPKLTITAANGRVLITSTVPEDDQARPVRGVEVKSGSGSAITDENGYATVPFTPGDTITAAGGGFESASWPVPAS
ncbi:hypothetical protein Mvan_2334 [Mycolicibacterium vanbaalenii PYR-1]|uniref:WD40 domain protein beta Propeller n=1 Tax=Mycolicibacterium vanbaalenii (strain DSM 7251 / JCM 13017 / BCRC 16820 / KCTC 9966 / NRRL B-24157 / PYR-1) TaxID=350058 RepID=A1T7J8_MYCVP|nr:hypothetical protein Mvan_2334 [Mycolicibacterium vanbaalenii PYR-1]